MEYKHEIALHNPTKAAIVDFPIEEIVVDENGDPIIDRDTQQWIPTDAKRTLTYSLAAGETLLFPKYVANYLRGIYQFLQEVSSDASAKKETKAKAEGKELPTEFACKIEGCDYVAGTVRGLALHQASKHPELFIE